MVFSTAHLVKNGEAKVKIQQEIGQQKLLKVTGRLSRNSNFKNDLPNIYQKRKSSPISMMVETKEKNGEIPTGQSPRSFPPGQEHHGSSIGHLAAVARRGAATSLEGLRCGASMCFKPLRAVAIIHSL